MYFKDFPKILYDFDITSGQTSGVQATAYSNLAADGVGSVTILNQGSGYKSASVTFSEPENTGVTATAYPVIVNGQIIKIIMKNAGAGYIKAPNVIITAPFGTPKIETRAYAMTDISRNIRFRKEILANITAYDEYDIVDGETPEIIAEKIYGSSEYHWVIMLANERYDYIGDFPLTEPMLEQFIKDKWGDSANSIHHYEDGNGNTVPSNWPLAVPVTNDAYEREVNESKRRIKVISKELLSRILKDFKDEL